MGVRVVFNHVIRGFFGLAVLAAHGFASAQPGVAQPPPLLVQLPQSAVTAARPPVIRSAVSGLRTELLGVDAVSATAVPPALRLDLFPDATYVVDLRSWQRRAPGEMVWHGLVRGRADSQVTFVSVAGIVAGSIRLGARTFEVMPAGANYAVSEIDDAQIPPGAPPLDPPLRRESASEALRALEFTDSPDLIDVMVLYTTGSRISAGGQAAIEARIQLGIEYTNLAYLNSAVRHRVRVVHRQEVSYQDSGEMGVDLGRLATVGDGYLDEVHALRDAHGADLVALTVTTDPRAAGMGFLNGPSTGSAPGGFSANVVAYVGAGGVLAHELGHNMGLAHDRANSDFQGAYSYAYGFQDPPYFRTVMAYSCTGAPCQTVAHFSNPRVAYLGRPTGVPDREDNVRALDEMAIYVANFRRAVYEAPYPSLHAISPDTSAASGGGEVTLTGMGFTAGSRVFVGGVESTTVTFVNSRTLRAVIPKGRAGVVEVSVVNPNGSSIVSPQAFAYFHGLALRFVTGSRGGPGVVDGSGPLARVDQPFSLASDGAGAAIFADRSQGLIRRVTPLGAVTTVAGTNDTVRSRDGTLESAAFFQPGPSVVDGAGHIFVADYTSIRKIAAGGGVTTIAGGFWYPRGLTLDGAGGFYVADTSYHRICHVSASGVVTTVAGEKGTAGSADGAAASARFSAPYGIVRNPDGSLFVTDVNNARIRRIAPDGAVTTLAGSTYGFADGAGGSAQFTYSLGQLIADGSGGAYVVDGIRVRHVTAAGVVTTVAGRTTAGSADGPVATATFESINGLAAAGSALLIGDAGTVRKLEAGQVTTIAGRPALGSSVDGPAGIARLESPTRVRAVGADVLMIDGGALRQMSANGAVTTIVASTFGTADGPPGTGRLYFTTAIERVVPGITHVLDYASVRRILADGTITTLAGRPDQLGYADGQGAAARFAWPGGLAVDSSGVVYVADTFNRLVRRVEPDGRVSTLAGAHNQYGMVDGVGSAARFSDPRRIVADGTGAFYVAESYAIRRVTSAGVVTTLAGGSSGSTDGRGAAASFRGITDIALGRDGRLYILDGGLLRVMTRQGVVQTLPLVAEDDLIVGVVPMPLLVRADSLTIDASGNVYVAAGRNRAIWRRAALPDSDGDGLPDEWEEQFGLDAHSASGADGAGGDPDGDGRTNADELADGTNPRGLPSLAIDRVSLRFGGVTSGPTLVAWTQSQVVRLTKAGSSPATWTATATQPWLLVSPSSGTGAANLSVSIKANSTFASPGSVTASIVFAVAGAANTPPPITVTLTLKNGASANPFGTIDTPLENRMGVTGAVPFTGWALDDVETAAVAVCRAPFGAEAAPPNPSCGGAAQVFIGSGVFIEGARPDVGAAYPTLPVNYRAGWGLMVLTNMLPNQGNGTYQFFAWAYDRDGHVQLLGTRTMTCDNAHATLPFGAIDTPEQGGTASGGTYLNFGWVLTPLPKMVPADGSTISVLVDGLSIGTVSYNHYRSDIATLFPGLNNTGGAIGFKSLDTTALSNGTHTIAWVASDNQGAADGIGSRFFTVSNGNAALTTPATASVDSLPADSTPIHARRGWDLTAPLTTLDQDASGQFVVRTEEVGRIELALGPGRHEGYLRSTHGLEPLPAGSHLDQETGAFTWAPGVAFLGGYDFVFTRGEAEHAVARRVRVVLHPKGRGAIGPQVVVDTPRSQQDVRQPFVVAGWAADLEAMTGTGVATIHAWAYPLTGGPPVFLGTADTGDARPDVAAVYGEQFARAGFHVTVQGLAHGHYDLALFAWSEAASAFAPATTVRLTVR
jgi:sugar lactone lactonase YvrE